MNRCQIVVNDKMQSGYAYELVAPEGKFRRGYFAPELTPRQMLRLGVFGGKYMCDCADEFPEEWFARAKLSPEFSAPEINFFQVLAGQSLREWRRNGWINDEHDPRGWFQWYCRYYRGRRLGEEDWRQMKRWRAYTRHYMQLRNNCPRGDLTCRPKQRQALLQWSYDTRKI